VAQRADRHRHGAPELVLAPGATIGILGGGQLGRMTALAAARLGYRCHAFADEPDSPAAQVCARSTVASFDDEITQDRLREKDFLRSIGIATTEYRGLADAEALREAMADFGRPAVLKSARLGYDGKGQVTIEPETAPAEAWRRMGGEIGILEAYVDFACEISVIVARRADGEWAAYPPVENRHVNHILDTTIAPARIAPETATRAEAIARVIAERLDLVGVLAVEMFTTRDGGLLVNELAPRPHNSGHWTIDACVTSQFEQLVRAICGLPLGSVAHHSDAVMKNLIGAEAETWRESLDDPLAKLHLYGKREAKPGRKMGHVTRLLPHR
jgi:5-(carboxyamino)imidazole ribonucleotide synthase